LGKHIWGLNTKNKELQAKLPGIQKVQNVKWLREMRNPAYELKVICIFFDLITKNNKTLQIDTY